jgi:uncharacterized membrane protein (UPF0127 family)
MIEPAHMTAAGVTLTNARSRKVIARDVELALTRRARRQGLLQRASLSPHAALVLAPCFMVHTAFMQFDIDVIFVDRQGTVKHLVKRLPPWRMTACRHAYATIELAAGTLDQHDVAVGDKLCLGAMVSMKLSA